MAGTLSDLTKRKRATAYHESGHAVACYTFGRPGVVVTIREGAMGPLAAGGISLGWDLRQSDIRGLNTRKIDETTVIGCAGPVAEARFLGEDPIEFLRRSHSAVGKPGSPLRALSGHASDWDLVLHIAQEITRIHGVSLVTTISYVLGRALEARQFIDEHWSGVEAIATALLRQKTLSWDDVEGILANR
jgi:ATP-dependent Zn protease